MTIRIAASRSHQPTRRRVLHLIDGSQAYPYLLSFAKYGSHEQFEYIVGSLFPPGPLQVLASKLGAGTVAMSITSGRGYPQGIVRLARWLGNHDIDIVQTHLFKPSVVGMAAARLAGVPVSLFTAHHVSEWEVTRLGSRRAGALDRFVRLRLADHVVAPSEYIARVLTASDGRTDTSLTVIPTGIDVESFAPIEGARKRTRAELGLDRATVFGAIGRISPVKNYPALVRGFARVASRDSSLVLLVIGQGSTTELSKLATSLGVGGQVRFLGWRDDVSQMLSALDVFVHASLAETFGRVVVEALAAGIPVIGSSVGIAPEIIEDGVNGFQLAGTDEDAIASGIQKMLDYRDRWSSMGATGQERVRSLSEPRMVASYEALYEQLLGAKR